ncbi:hypothetical protein Q4Q34_04175 [Flavivirga abyssicola]|uniref:ATP-binding protein n=1 Tax=Flavivirga abyssicola TaxID=3063533 RepID=UPI0026DFB5DB|nr:tetratricopeptide repeat-containing sensor histidine kinase [Flavivirga sp. MEBiC07777]WVK14224.1 hypothetical protein Q4Q34_04175 [Flavivirga sp. MEBiC07777]
MDYKLLVIVFISLLYSCEYKEAGNIENHKMLDSISSYYNFSKDKTQNPAKRKEAINNAYRLLFMQPNDTLLYKVLYRKAIIHNVLKEYDSLIYYNALLLKKATISNNYYYQGKANYLKAYYLNTVKYMPDSAFSYYNQSKNNFIILKDSSEIGKRLLNMAYIQQSNSDYFGSKETITNALKYLSLKKDEKYVASAYYVLASNNKNLLNFEDAIEYYKKAIEITKSDIDKLAYKNNLAILYIEKKAYGKAISILEVIIKDSLVQKNVIKKARAIDNLAYALWLGKSKNVENLFFDALNIRVKHNDKYGLLASYNHLGEFYLKKDSKKSLVWFNKALKTSKTIKNAKGEIEALRALMKVAPNNLKIKNRYIALSDSLQKQELKVKTQFAKIQYDDQLKNEEIQKLKILTVNQQLEVSIQKRQKVIYLLIGIILIILVVFYVYSLIQKHKKDKVQEVYKTEKNISKRVHDEIANDISVLTNFVEDNLDLGKPSSKELLENKLHNIYLRARDISTDISSIDLTDFKKELKNLIVQYNTNHVNVITNLDDYDWQMIADYKKIAVYRVIQELLINAKKHSGCKRITLMLNDKAQNRIITYTDNGVGCIKSNIKSNGLANAENRINNIKGTFNFDTSLGNGFKATIIFQK